VSDRLTRHEDVAGYVLASLAPDERAAFEDHLAGCASCRAQVRELSVPAELLARAVPAYDVPPGLETRTLAAVRSSVGVNGDPSPRPLPRRRAWRRPLALAASVAVLLAGGVLAGTLLERSGGAGEVEIEAVLSAPSGGAAQATVVVVKTGIGREISFRSDDLPILPKGDFYELWFVGPGDTLRRPNRISAGTFHPDEQGRSHVELTAAVDPALYPVVSVTAEPGDGNPRRTGPEVLRSRPG
jgi:anti-sigma-K factor RskA